VVTLAVLTVGVFNDRSNGRPNGRLWPPPWDTNYNVVLQSAKQSFKHSSRLLQNEIDLLLFPNHCLFEIFVKVNDEAKHNLCGKGNSDNW